MEVATLLSCSRHRVSAQNPVLLLIVPNQGLAHHHSEVRSARATTTQISVMTGSHEAGYHDFWKATLEYTLPLLPPNEKVGYAIRELKKQARRFGQRVTGGVAVERKMKPGRY